MAEASTESSDNTAQIYSEQRGRIRYVVFNRPEKLNAFTRAMEDQLYRILEEIRADEGTSVVVLKGKGRAFSAGHDLNESYTIPEDYAIRTTTGDERRRGFRQLESWFSLLWELPQPVIAQVQGHCWNYALELAMNSDFVICSEDAQFVHRPVGGAAREFHLWPWLIGPRKAKEFGMLGKACTGTEAERLGMVNQAVTTELLEETVNQFAEALAKVPLELLALEKKSVNVSMEMLNIRTALSYTMELHALSHLTEASQELARSKQEKGWREAWAERDQNRYSGG